MTPPPEPEPYVTATVVWRRAPSSARVGAKAVVRPDGTMEGWLSGACAESTVIREALDALVDGRPRLVFLGPADDEHRRDGVVTVPMACDSEGALEVYLEPVVPVPHVVVVGHSPAASSLLTLAGQLGWRTTALDEGADDVPPADAVVIASQGHGDETALAAALATDAAYVGLVASSKRAAAVLERLRTGGVDDEALLRVRAPAGMDLGSIEPAEIGVAVLAELVALRAHGSLRLLPALVEAAEHHCCHHELTEL